MEQQRKHTPKRPDEQEPSGDPEEMKALGESISGKQEPIGHKDTGIGRKVRERPEYPPSAP